MPGSPRIALHAAPASAVGVPLLLRGPGRACRAPVSLHSASWTLSSTGWQWLCYALQQSPTSIQLQSQRHLEHIPDKSLYPAPQGVTSKLGIQVTGCRWPCLTSLSILSSAESRQGMTDRSCFFRVFYILFNIQLSGRGICWPQQCCI